MKDWQRIKDKRKILFINIQFELVNFGKAMLW